MRDSAAGFDIPSDASNGRLHAQGRIREIDGLRAFAVAGVVAYHFELGPTGGYLGVDLFFVISGYVITRTLLAERAATGTTSFSRFWLRRITRIFPSLAVVLLAVGLWARIGGSDAFIRAASQQSLAAVVSGVNWWQIYGPTGYWDLGAQASPLTHLWSLAVEEQFYLIWPLLFSLVFFLSPPHRWMLVGALAAASYLSAAVLADPQAIAQDFGVLNRLYEGTDTRAGALLLGCAAALAPRRHPFHEPHRRWARTVAIGLAVACLIGAWVSIGITDAALHRGVLAATGLSAAVLVHSAGDRSLGVLAPLLRWGPLHSLGILSYVIYLWHWPVWVWSGTTPLTDQPLLRAATSLAITLGLALVTHHLVEMPVLRRGLGWPAAAALLVAVSAVIIVNATTLLMAADAATTVPATGIGLPYIPA